MEFLAQQKDVLTLVAVVNNENNCSVVFTWICLAKMKLPTYFERVADLAIKTLENIWPEQHQTMRLARQVIRQAAAGEITHPQKVNSQEQKSGLTGRFFNR